MRKQIEEQCMKTISEFYCNKNYDFFDYLEDRVIYYSPGKDHIIQGREELCEYFKNLKNSLEFETGNARAKLINLKPGVFLINTELELKIIHKNGKTKIINQRIALALRQTRTNGIMRETCPYIQISNLINTNAENNNETEKNIKTNNKINNITKTKPVLKESDKKCKEKPKIKYNEKNDSKIENDLKEKKHPLIKK